MESEFTLKRKERVVTIKKTEVPITTGTQTFVYFTTG